jgi:hypothetical protein
VADWTVGKEEGRCSVKLGWKTAEIKFRLKGDGSMKEKWEEAKRRTWGAE